MTVTFELDLYILPLDLHAKIQAYSSVCSAVRARQAHLHTNDVKTITPNTSQMWGVIIFMITVMMNSWWPWLWVADAMLQSNWNKSEGEAVLIIRCVDSQMIYPSSVLYSRVPYVVSFATDIFVVSPSFPFLEATLKLYNETKFEQY